MTTLSYNGTVSNLQTSLQTLVSSLIIGEYRRIKYTPTETSGQFVNGHLYEGFFSRTGSNYWSLTLEDPEGQPVYGTYRNGTWAWDKLAEQTQIDTLNANLMHNMSCGEARNNVI